MIDVYESAVGPTGLYGAVFERDAETAYFYLSDLTRPAGDRIMLALNLNWLHTSPADTAFTIRWSSTGEAVGLFADGVLSAVFDMRGGKPAGRPAEARDEQLFLPH